MVKKIVEQQTNVNDSCTDCGSFVDIGAVIEEQDTTLVISSTDYTASSLQVLADKAKARFSQCEVAIEQADAIDILTIRFDVAAEKMIFQLEQQL